uniref:Uncharacterized protein n=1 Tax=Homalodisca liturata TaxID=320908 RepID=A0A1B6J2M9_9HEMI
MKFRISIDGYYLETYDFNDSHNHDHSKEMYEFLPRQRKLKHILQARNMNEINVIHEELVPEILKTSSDLENSRLVESNYQQIPSMIDSVNVISQQERYEIALSKTQRLANLLSEAPSETFFQRLVNLETLIYNWENNEEVSVISLNSKNDCSQDFIEIDNNYVLITVNESVVSELQPFFKTKLSSGSVENYKEVPTLLEDHNYFQLTSK